eukprot:TRINITY_DN29060_c0_g1_i1.p1 TRINITY_DN29060_c0_g1~~TRINITY_DN29060_c0_g1_i1.p1  ORF type:complete len:521 (-),score=92.55 TRINITY_DN29060_c0_g1_i1:58-1620(-)
MALSPMSEPTQDMNHIRLGHKRNVVLLGPPAGGKGTQSELLVEKYGMVHISTGDLLRARMKLFPELASYMNNGKLVPDHLVTAVLKERLADRDCSARGVLLDGYPRTAAQAESLRAAGVQVTDVIHLKVADEVVIERISGRRIDPVSGRVYHIKYNEPPPEVLSRIIQREDDTEDKVKSRLKTYHAEVGNIVNFYGSLVKEITIGGDGPSALPEKVRPMVVFEELRKALEGDTYWGSVIRSKLQAKVYECGTHSTSLISVTRYFEHARYGLLRHGCLSEALSRATRTVLRAQVVTLGACLQPDGEYHVRAWLERIGKRAVVVGHNISQKLSHPAGHVIEVARASAALVFLGRRGEAMEVPHADQLRDLVRDSKTIGGHSPVNELEATTPEAMDEMLGIAPEGCYNYKLTIPAVDLDVHGKMAEAACVAMLERVRFEAAREGGYARSLCEVVKKAYTTRAFVTYMGFSTQGDVVEVATWAVSPKKEQGDTVHLAFEVRSTGVRSAVVLRGLLVVVAPLQRL